MYDEKTEVEFAFMKKNYYRLGKGESEVRGIKTLRLFKSWFKLMKSRKRLLYGTLKFLDTNETWIWQPRNPIRTDKNGRGGWQKVK